MVETRSVTPFRCFRCGELRKLRRMLCENCYDLWLQSRPIGVGACCQRCGDRRRVHLRYFELQRGFAVLCHNCTAQAQALPRLPRSVEGLLERLERERRRGERRRPGRARPPDAPERRLRERRLGMRDLFDATEWAVELQDEPSADSALTRVHRLTGERGASEPYASF